MKDKTHHEVRFDNLVECMRCGDFYHSKQMEYADYQPYLECPKCIRPWPEQDFPLKMIPNPVPEFLFHNLYNDVPLCIDNFATVGYGKVGCITVGRVKPADF